MIRDTDIRDDNVRDRHSVFRCEDVVQGISRSVRRFAHVLSQAVFVNDLGQLDGDQTFRPCWSRAVEIPTDNMASSQPPAMNQIRL